MSKLKSFRPNPKIQALLEKGDAHGAGIVVTSENFHSVFHSLKKQHEQQQNADQENTYFRSDVTSPILPA